MNEKNFGNSLSAFLEGEEEGDYVKTRDGALKQLDEVEGAVKRTKVEDINSYNEAMKLKGALSSLFCYTANSNKPEVDRVGDIECALGAKLFKFANKHKKINDKTVKALAKYAITNWQHYYTREDVTKIVERLKNADVLYQSEGSYLITGLHYSVGDNVFGVSSNGSEYRLMQRSCALQAFYVNDHWTRLLSELKPDAPELPNFYNKVGTGDGKYLAKVYLTREEHQTVRGFC